MRPNLYRVDKLRSVILRMKLYRFFKCLNQITQGGKACANKIVPDQTAPRGAV